jgi:hypothetical protein
VRHHQQWTRHQHGEWAASHTHSHPHSSQRLASFSLDAHHVLGLDDDDDDDGDDDDDIDGGRLDLLDELDSSLSDADSQSDESD